MNNPIKEKKDVIIKSLDRTLEIVELLAATPQSMSVQQLSEALNVNRTTLYAALNTLCNRQFIEKDPLDGRFSIGSRMYEIGLKYKYKFPFVPAAERQAKKLFLQFGHQINLSIFQHPDIALSLISEFSNSYIPFLTPSYYILPAHASAVGKVLLAGKTDKELESIISRITFKQYTPSTITSKEALLEELYKCRENGYAVDHEEYSDCINCIAVPIRDYQSNVIAGFSISCMTEDYLNENFNELKEAIISGARQISLSIGWRP